MSLDIVTDFFRRTPLDPATAWDIDTLTQLANRSVPDIFFRDRKILLMADQSRLWSRWFLEGLVTPWPFVEDMSKSRLHIFEAALKTVNALYPEEDQNSKRRLAEAVSDHLFAEVQRRRSAARDFATFEKKRELLEASLPPRCYLCGYAFSADAIDKLLRVKGRNSIQLPLMVDILRPRGLKPRDLAIEIEHVVPVASGGSGSANLRLACGWCNRYKGDKTSVYDASFATSRISFSVGAHKLHEMPNPFWVIRLLGVHTRCQHLDGCNVTTSDQELFVALRDWTGSPNPTNLKFYCLAHDPIAPFRFFSRDDACRIWNSRSR